MNSSPHSSVLAEEQASLWAARLDGSALSAADRVELESWLAADPAHRALLSTYCQFSADLEQQLPLLAGARDELAEKTVGAASRSPWWRWPAWAGATLAAAAALAVFLWPGQPQQLSTKLGTPVAERHRHTLADGSVIELNAQTAVAIEFGATERRARLAGGEAFFTIARDAARPFYVETPAGSVRVTGTEFNVRTGEGADLEVTVLEGSVQVRPGAAAAARSLRTGDRLVAAGGRVDVTALSPNQLNDTLAWRQGQVVFDGTPLREALGRFARYHGRTLTASEAAARQRVGGRYSLDDLDGFLSTLEEILPVRVARGFDGAIHVGAVGEP
jgi:transmembrane sensor